MRFVGFFDVLGMTCLVRRDLDGAWRELNNLWESHDDVRELTIALKPQGVEIRDRLKTFTFSDTIIMYTKSDSDDDVFAISLLAGELFERARSVGIPLRGGIAHGEFRTDECRNIFVGPALLDAYRLGETAQWVGVCAQESLNLRARELHIQAEARWPIFTEWQVPLKKGVEPRVVLDWPAFYRPGYIGKTPRTTAPEFYQPFSRLFGPWQELGAAARSKYEASAHFRNERLAIREA